MTRRVYICGLDNYPRGGACANYLQYLADALLLAGYKVTMICSINNEFSCQKKMNYRGAEIIEIMHKGPVCLFNRLMNGKLFQLRFYRRLRKMNISKDDLVISESTRAIRNPVVRLQKKRGFKHCGYILEWFPKETYSNSAAAVAADIRFRSNGELDFILPISHHIADQFKGSRAKVMVLPIMADTEEYAFIEKTQKPYKFILPAMGAMKDSLENMMLALDGLTDDELSSFKFHITGVKQERVEEILGNKWQRIKDTLIFHSWMKYDELIDLYRQCHYLFLARDVNQMTLSNFPSKVPETMTHGIVPVCSDVGDYTKYYLTDNTDSLIFEGCSSEECCHALRRALSIPFDQYQILSRNARKCVEDKFDYHNWSNALKNNIEALFGSDQK